MAVNKQSSNNDPKGYIQNMVQDTQNTYRSQQQPLFNAAAENYGRGSETNFNDYNDIMSGYRSIANGSGDSGGGGGGGGGFNAQGMYTPFTVTPERVSAERVSSRALSPLERVTAQQLNPLQKVAAQKLGPLERTTASDPYKSYSGYQNFADTGGYSEQDMANMRSRGTSPVRAAYANAQREVSRQRSLQGGYSANAGALQARMAREQGQSAADAMQGVEAGLATARNAGRLSGLQGMAGIEGNRQQAQLQSDIFNAGQANQGQQFDISNAFNADQFNSNQAFQGNQFDISNRLNADQYNSGQAFQGQQFDIGNENQANQFNATNALNAGQFNAGLNFQGQTYNADAQTRAQAQNIAAGEAAASRGAAAAAQSNADRFRALSGMTQLYGTTPGMSELFGNQAIQLSGQGGQIGNATLNSAIAGQALPGAYDQTMNRLNQGMDMVGRVSGAAYPWLNNGNNNNGGRTGGGSQPITTQPYDWERY